MRASLLYAVVVALAVSVSGGTALSADAISRRLTGSVTTYVVAKGDTLGSIGARFGVDAATLAADNALRMNAVLVVGHPLRVDNRHLVPAAVAPGVLVVNVPQRMLFYQAGDEVEGVPVAVGRPGWRTPLSPFTVLTRETDPSWEVPASIREEARLKGRSLPAVVPPGPSNPLGRFWLGLSIPSVGIHSTNAPASIYGATTHGCIRVGPDNMARLFPRVEVGTPGQVVYEPILLAAVGDAIFLEVHRDVYGHLPGDPYVLVRAAARRGGLDGAIDWAQADAAIAARHGIARVVGTRERARRD